MTKTSASTMLLIGLLLMPAISEGREHRCDNVLAEGSYLGDCESFYHCIVRKRRPNTGFCVTADRKEHTLALKPGEQMCCTKTEAIKMEVKPGGTLACNNTEAKVFYPDAPEIKAAVAECMKDKELADQCAPKFCCKAKNCAWRIVNEREGEQLGCTAVAAFTVKRLGGMWSGLVCNDETCLFAALDPATEEMACPRFYTVPPSVGQNEGIQKGPSKGSDAAPITIVEFSDFQCPYCVRAEETVKRLLETVEYRGKIKLVYRDYPLPSHDLAPKAAEAAHCAADQGKYWEMHDKLFEASPQLEVADLKGYAREIKLDVPRFEECLVSGATSTLVLDDVRMGEEICVSATPTFFINGQVLSGAQPLEAFKAVIDAELAPKSATSTKIGEAPAVDAGAGMIPSRR